MRIGINALYLIPGKTGGMSVYLINYLKYLQEIDTENEYYIYTSTEGADALNVSAPNFHKVRCPMPARLRSFHYFWELFILPFQALKDRIELLHSMANIAPIYLPCKSVITIHDIRPYYISSDFPRSFTYMFKKLLPLMAKHAARVITVSEYSKKAISDVLDITTDKITAIPLASGLGPVTEKAKKEIKAQYNIDGYIFTLLTAIPHKNMDGLIKAYKILASRQKEVPELVVAGITGPVLEDVKNRVRGWGLEKKIIFPGYIPDEHLPALYQSARLFIFPSKYEGFGLPVLEAMSYGVPVVSSSFTALPEVVGDAGLMFDPDNPDEMADAMERVLGDEELSRNLVEKGLQKAAAYSWEKVAKETLKVYLNL